MSVIRLHFVLESAFILVLLGVLRKLLRRIKRPLVRPGSIGKPERREGVNPPDPVQGQGG